MAKTANPRGAFGRQRRKEEARTKKTPTTHRKK